MNLVNLKQLITDEVMPAVRKVMALSERVEQLEARIKHLEAADKPKAAKK